GCATSWRLAAEGQRVNRVRADGTAAAHRVHVGVAEHVRNRVRGLSWRAQRVRGTDPRRPVRAARAHGSQPWRYGWTGPGSRARAVCRRPLSSDDLRLPGTRPARGTGTSSPLVLSIASSISAEIMFEAGAASVR